MWHGQAKTFKVNLWWSCNCICQFWYLCCNCLGAVPQFYWVIFQRRLQLCFCTRLCQIGLPAGFKGLWWTTAFAFLCKRIPCHLTNKYGWTVEKENINASRAPLSGSFTWINWTDHASGRKSEMEGTKLGPTTGCADSVLSQTKPSSQSQQCFSMKALSTPLLPTLTTAPPPRPKDDCHPAGGLCLLVFVVGSYLFVLRPSQLCPTGPGRANDCCGTPLLLRWRHVSNVHIALLKC